MIVSSFKNPDSLSFTYVSLVLGEEITERLKLMMKTEIERNKKYYNMSDNLFNLRLVSKARLIIPKS